MSQNLYWIVCATSMVFNATFGLGYLSASREATTLNDPEVVTDRIDAMLDLDLEQSRLYRDMHDEIRQQREELKSAIQLTEQSILDEHAKANADAQRLAQLQDESEVLRTAYHRTASDRMQRFMEALRPEQRRTMADRIGQRMNWQRGGTQPMQRFDRNGDGQLDLQERQDAHESMRERVRDFMQMRQRANRTDKAPEENFQQMRQRLMDRFDLDGDGQLSAEERQKARQTRPGDAPRRTPTPTPTP